jgi:peptidoglycan/xylan/chitin deacetylase (PgdA/CDA1 family)
MLKKFGMLAATVLFTLMPFSKALAATGPNLITNPSADTSTNSTTPDGWQSSFSGTNTSMFSYPNTGHTGAHSMRVDTTAYTNGAANWFYTAVPVTAGQTYEFSDWYQSNVDTEVDAEVHMADGTTQVFYVGNVLTSAAWAQYRTTFTAPAGAQSVVIYHLLGKVGYLVTDDYSLGIYTAVGFTRPIVSVTLDDGWANQYANALPALNANGIKATFYIISGSLTDTPDYMSSTQVKALSDAGYEIGDHTITHTDLTTVTSTVLTSEMKDSQTTLQNLTGKPVTDFAYPYGAYNTATITEGKKYFASQRTVDAGLNTKDNLDATKLKMYEVDNNITQAQVKAWVDEAIASKSWLILTYHEVATTPVDPTDVQYTTQPADFAAEMAYIKSTGVATETVAQALQEVLGTVTVPVTKPGDLNGDNVVDALDLSTMLTNWNKTSATAAQGDLNADGTVDALDLSTLLTNWSK